MKRVAVALLSLPVDPETVIPQEEPGKPVAKVATVELKAEAMPLREVMAKIGSAVGYTVVVGRWVEHDEQVSLDLGPVSLELMCELVEMYANVSIFVHHKRKLIEVQPGVDDPFLHDDFVFDLAPVHEAFQRSAARLGPEVGSDGSALDLNALDSVQAVETYFDYFDDHAVNGLDRMSIGVLSVSGQLTEQEQAGFEEFVELATTEGAGESRALQAQTEVWRKLREGRLSLEAEDTPLGDVLALVSRTLKVPVVLMSPENAEISVTLSVADQPALATLNVILALAGLEMMLWRECVAIGVMYDDLNYNRSGGYAVYDLGPLVTRIAADADDEDVTPWTVLEQIEVELEGLYGVEQAYNNFIVFGSRVLVLGDLPLQARVRKLLTSKGWKE